MSKQEAIKTFEKIRTLAIADGYDAIVMLANTGKRTLEQVELVKTWIPVSDRLPPQMKDSYLSEWVIVADGRDWTIARYDYHYHMWQKGHPPYDLDMGQITHWMRIER